MVKLPDFLTADEDGFIHAAGHRIGLNHVIRVYNEGYSAEMIRERYPTLPLAMIHKIIAFYLENQAETDAYVSAQGQEIQRQMSTAPTGPTLTELRQRLEVRRRTQTPPSAPLSTER